MNDRAMLIVRRDEIVASLAVEDGDEVEVHANGKINDQVMVVPCQQVSGETTYTLDKIIPDSDKTCPMCKSLVHGDTEFDFSEQIKLDDIAAIIAR